MMCAGTAAAHGARVTLVEKNPILGKKLRITGKGRCNVTNKCDAATFERNVRPDPRFLRGAYADFDSDAVMGFFEGLGVPLKVERGNRVFPVSDKASDIAQALESFMLRQGVKVHRGAVSRLMLQDGSVRGVQLEDGALYSSKVVVATGGLSYPGTGSTGDGYGFARQAGHTVVEPRASLVPLCVEQKDLCAAMQGLSLRNVRLKLLRDGRELFSDFGEMLFTHFGLSGPTVLTLSAYALPGDTVSIDLKPALDPQTLYKRLCSDFEKYKNKNFANSLNDLLPNRLISVIISMSGISEYKKVNSLTRAERSALAQILKDMRFTVSSARPVSEAIVTAGGVSLKEVSAADMQSRLVRGLYFIGEVLDLDANTGGFNLQIAFSTAHRAAEKMFARQRA